MSYYSLPCGKLYKKDDIKKLNSLTANYSRLFYRDRANDVDVDLPSTVVNKILAERQPLTNDIKNFLLGTSEYAKDIQSDIDLYVTRGRHNQASFRCKLDPTEKSIWRRENPLALLFKDVANFDAQNPAIGSLREIELGKNKTKSSLISTALDINDTILLQRSKKSKEAPINYTDDDDNDDNNGNNTNTNTNTTTTTTTTNIPLGPPSSPPNFGNIFDTTLVQVNR